jgi:hypothetical protein
MNRKLVSKVVSCLGLVFVFAILISSVSAEVTFLNKWGSLGSGDGQFYGPGTIAVSPTGQVYVADQRNGRIQRFDPVGEYQIQWGSQGSDSGEMGLHEFHIAVSDTGQVYVADSSNNRIQVFSADGTYEREWGSSDSGDQQFQYPTGIAVSDIGQVYVTQWHGHHVQRFDTNGEYQMQWGSLGSDDGDFYNPGSVVLSPTGQVYVADTANHRIQRFDADGKYSLEWEITQPGRVAVSDTGHVYVADSNNYRIQVFSADGTYERQWGSSDGGQLAPYGVAIAHTGHVYVSDYTNNCIQRFFDPDAWFSGTNTFVDGSVGPTSVEVGPSGHILGAALTLDSSKGLVVGDTTTVWGGGSLSMTGGALSTSTLTTWPGSSLSLSGGILSASVLNLDSGSFQFTGGTLNLTGPSGLTVGAGGLLGSLVTVGNGQTVNVTSATTVESGSRITVLGDFSSTLLKVASGGQFDAPSGYTNNDEIQMAGSEAWIMGSTLTNNGFISGQGRINAALTNHGQVNVPNGTLSFGSRVTNDASGFISSQGTANLQFDHGLYNSGNVLLSFASSTVFGNITNNPDGTASLAGNSTATFVGNMVNNGMIYVGSGSHAVFGGDTSGSGSFTGTGVVEFAGAVSPGNSPGTVSFGGDVVLGVGSTTVIELGGTSEGQYDQLLIAGHLDIGGQLTVELLDGFVPGEGDLFDVLDFTTRSGSFQEIHFPVLPEDLLWDTSVLLANGTLSVRSSVAGLHGDFNYDGTVDAADYTVWQDNLGLASSALNGNGSGAATVVQADYLLWKTNFEALATGSDGTAAVPEPTALLLAFLALVAAPLRVRCE